jgi:hypothetical protein
MNAKGMIWAVAAASLVTVSASIGRTQSAQHESHGSGAANGSSRSSIVRAVRQATERFQHVSAAIAAGYVQFQGCVSGPQEGAMGVHYSNFSLFDGRVDIEHPQVLVYEPRNGRLHLVAAEYVVPAGAWDPTHDPFDKPALQGHLYHFAPGPNRYGPDAFYELHVWAWKDNPRGTFADWNRDVSCADWEAASF